MILACRDETKARKAVEQIKKKTNNDNVCYKLLQLDSFASVRRFAKEITATEDGIDILVNNAGISFWGPKFTEDGIPLAFQINYLSHFLLTNLLLGIYFI